MWPAQARALSKYNLVILNAGGEEEGAQHQKWEWQALGFVTVLVHSEFRNYLGHQTAKTEENSEAFFIPLFYSR